MMVRLSSVMIILVCAVGIAMLLTSCSAEQPAGRGRVVPESARYLGCSADDGKEDQCNSQTDTGVYHVYYFEVEDVKDVGQLKCGTRGFKTVKTTSTAGIVVLCYYQERW